MTTELILLLALFVFILSGSFLNKESGVEGIFRQAAPRLGARVERHLETGSGFDANWEAPPRR